MLLSLNLRVLSASVLNFLRIVLLIGSVFIMGNSRLFVGKLR